MISVLPPPLRGSIILFLMVANTIFWCSLFMPVAVLKLCPHAGWRRWCTRALQRLGMGWIAGTNAIIRRLPIEWEIEAPGGLRRDRSYAIIANHRSWADIPILLQFIDRQIPFPVFFVKKELLWFPFIGLAMWALDFPFVERHSREAVARRPALRGRDLATARRACEKYREIPATLVIFPEGTRFTREKWRRLGGDFRHLLPPRSGGTSVVLSVLGDRLAGLFDATIIYPAERCGFWDFLCGRIPHLGLQVRPIAGPSETAASDDAAWRGCVHAWMIDLWREKDQSIGELRRKLSRSG